MSDDFTSRPSAKRVRSEQDHSKAETKHTEEKEHGGAASGKDKDGSGEGHEDHGKHEDDDWLAQPPYSMGKSWDGWTTKWRESCWCGKCQ